MNEPDPDSTRRAPAARQHPKLPRKWLFFGAFVLLVVTSNFVRSHWPMLPQLEPGQRAVEVQMFAREESPPPAAAAPSPAFEDMIVPVAGKTVTLAVRDSAATAAPTPSAASASPATSTPAAAPAVLLLHGIPGSSKNLRELYDRLAASGRYRVIAPDLPGMGASQRVVADYAADVSARAMLDLLDKLGVRGRVHIVGEGQGGVVALNLARIAPARVASLSLVASSSIQEYELLGNHVANIPVYFFHRAFIFIYQNLIPHFGLFDRGGVNGAYARVFWDTSCVNNKRYLRDYDGPLFLAHGEDDYLVPVDAPRYVAREIAPQAREFYTPGGHYVFEDAAGAALLAPRLEAFFADAAAARGSRTAPAPALDKIPEPPPAHGARLYVLMLIILVCAFVAEDPVCLASGLLVHLGIIGWFPATLACLVSILIGDFTLYLLGYALGRPALRKAPLKWFIAEYEIDRMAGWFEKKGFQGLMLIVTSRFIPASRVPTFVCAGIMRLSIRKLSLLFVIAAAVWAPVMVLGVGWLMERFGWDREHLITGFEHLKHSAMWIILGALAALWFVLHFIVPALTWRGRRELVMKARKRLRHEFWPASWLYAPVALGVLARGLLRLHGAAHTAANPGLGWLGGATGEAKSETLEKISTAAAAANADVAVNETDATAAAADAPTANDAPAAAPAVNAPTARHGTISVAAFARIPAGGAPDARAALVREFMAVRGLAYPIALKPDCGDGGLGVNRIQSDAQLAEWFERFHEDALAQQWVEGREFEIVWARPPGAAKGGILAVVEKLFPAVTGDGRRTLEDLIWADDTAVSQAKLYLRLNWHRTSATIPAGERVVLTHVGTHALGARMRTLPEACEDAALAAAFDQFADAVGGLHYAVFDVRQPAPRAHASVERGADAPVLRAGEMTLTGISGPCAVSSLLRDPSLRLPHAHAAVHRQLAAAYAAARATNRRPAPFLAALASWAESRSRQIIDLRSE